MRLFRGERDITEEVPASALVWKRISRDPVLATGDAAWNASHAGAQVEITANEIAKLCRFECSYSETEGVFGSVSVDESLMASHNPGVSDASDVLHLDDGMLVVSGSPRGGNADYYLEDGKLMVNPGFTGTITAVADFSPEAQRKVVSFYYDHNGLRTRKVVWDHGVTETYDYTLHGKLITHMTKRTVDEEGNESSQELHFFYDSQSKPAFVEFEGERYRYVHSLQGDIIAIVDSAANTVVEYKYDAWGTILSQTGNIANALSQHNPFRYCGYFYDEETRTYWLKSRYYYPKLHRFCSVDLMLGNIGSVFAHNAWAYCYNKPTVFIDPDGQLPSFPKGSFRFDWAGVKILLWYLFGRGKRREIKDGAWSNYMKKSKTCASSCCGSKKSTTLSEYTYSLLRPYADGIKEGEVRTVKLQEKVSLQNGESIFGYNYLHGVNGAAGGYVVSATITRYCGYITYDVTCTWNDVMDPNFSYESDKIKAEFAQSIPLANPTDYSIAITWNDTFIENIGGVSVPKY